MPANFTDNYHLSHSQLPIGHADKSLTEAQANPDDYVYLCSDGTKVPVTGPACTWAARPWQAYVGNGDIRQKVENLTFKLSRIHCLN